MRAPGHIAGRSYIPEENRRRIYQKIAGLTAICYKRFEMGKTSVIFGAALGVLGLGGYVLGGMSSATALIPLFFGLLLAGLGWVVTRLGATTGGLIGLLVLGAVGVLAPLGRVIPALSAGGEPGLAFWVNALMAVICGIFTVLCVKALAARPRPSAVAR
jgi:hypothetical protein